MATKVNGLIQKVDPGNGTQYSVASTAYGYCETAAGTAAKVVDMTGFTLIEGTTIHVKFNEKNTAANPTLNVNGTGAKPIVQYGTTAVGTISSTNGWYDGAVISFTYDGVSWVRDQGFNTNTTYSVLSQSDATAGTATAERVITAKVLHDTIVGQIQTLDGNITGTPGAGKTLTSFSETDGIVTATFGNISITKSQISDFPTSIAPSSHTHGNIQNGGTLQTNDITIANGDKLVVTDASDSNKVARASISFDGTTTTQALTKAGTWVTFNNYSHPTTTAVDAAAVKVGKDSTGHVVIGDALTAADVGVSATTTSVTVGSTTFSKYVHPTTSGNKHIPSGGSSGQILRWSADGTAVWGADNNNTYTAGAGLTLTGNEFSITTGGVTNAMLAGSIANGKLTNSSISIAGTSVSLGGSISADTLKTNLGLTSAMHYIGKTTTAITDGGTTTTVSIAGTNKTVTSGDVVIDSNSEYEYVWNGDNWERLGPDGSYKVVQTAVSDPTANGNSTSFIATISQDTQGVITATKKTVPDASTSTKGIIQITNTNANSFLNTLTTGDSVPADNDYYISQYVNGGTTTTTYHRRPVSKLYDYIKTKLAVTNNNTTVTWNTETTIATIGGTAIKIKIPANPNTNSYISAAAFADDTTNNADSPIKMSLTRSGSSTATITANIPKVSADGAGVVPKGTAVSSQSQSTKFLREDGTWAAPSYTSNTHYTTHLRTASSATGTTQVTTETTSPYLNLLDDSTVRDSVRFVGSGTTTVKASADGKTITISSADSKTGTVTKVSTGAGLTGGDITTTGTIKANLNSETSLGTIGTTSKLYAVGVDANGKLAVNVPWENTTSSTITANATDGVWDVTGTNGTNAVTYAVAPYSAQQAKASFDTSTTLPTRTDRLNYNGYLYATKLYSGGVEVLTSHQSLSNYKTKQTAVESATAESSTATTFVYSVTQNANGEITVKTRNLPTYSNNAGTVTKVTAGTGLNTTADQADSATKGSITSTGTLYLTTSGVTANTYGNTSQQTPSHGGTFNIPYFTVDKYGRVTYANTTTVKLPADNNTDTKVNVVARGTTKAYILADTTAPTAAAVAHTAVAETAVYMDTTAGAVAATSYKVAEKVILQYNTTTNALDFIFQ